MKFAPSHRDVVPDSLPQMPRWVSLTPAETPEDVAFLSGAALAVLHLMVARAEVPHALWRQRQALGAAEACVGFAGRRERAADLRDAVHMLRPGDHPGPAGEIFQRWSRVVARPVSAANLIRALPDVTADQIAFCLDTRPGNPVSRAADVMAAVLTDSPRAEASALILADAALARALGWDHVMPLLALGLKTRDLRQRDADLRLACQRAIVTAAQGAMTLAADLARRAQALRAVAPILRAKGAAEAVALFLARDALAPAALSGLMSDRAARRLCDRLVELGALRELTGRATFRLYGV
jgi:hypothetical protein